MNTDDGEPKVDRTVLTVSTTGENDEDEYWQSKTPQERLEAIEINRRIVYGYKSTPPGLRRVLEVARR